MAAGLVVMVIAGCGSKRSKHVRDNLALLHALPVIPSTRETSATSNPYLETTSPEFLRRILCPQRVVIGGGVVQAGELLEPLRRSVAERARVAPLDRIAIATAELGPHAGAIGAALWGAEI